MGPVGIEPTTLPLSGARSNQLSYGPRKYIKNFIVRYHMEQNKKNKGGDPAARSRTATLLRLHPPCQPHRGPT